MSLTTNRNILTNTGFAFSLARSPNLNFFVTRVQLPAISLPASNGMPTPFSKIQVPGDRIEFGTIDITFLLDENMRTYTEILTWMFGLGFPESFDQYRQLAAQAQGFRDVSDGTLSIMDSNFAPVMHFRFVDMFPTNLAGIEMAAGNTDASPIEMTVSFAYTRFTVDQPERLLT